jgi:predicted MPP superfamily phosphohydrolase
MPLLSVGLNGPLVVREEVISERPDACRVLYASDLHLRRSRSERLSRQVTDAANRARADLILLGGDLIDETGELDSLSDLIRTLGGLAPVYAVGGNHDRRIGMNLVRDAVCRGGGEWIHDRTVTHTHGRRRIVISGPDAGPSPGPAPGGDVRILCAHYPAIWNRTGAKGFDLVLAGHLHGCQFVAFEWRGRQYPGAFFYTNCGRHLHDGASHLVVSHGVSDLVPIRWRCPRDVVVCLV